MVGVDTQMVHGYVNCGARGAITGVGNALPREALHLAKLCEQAAAGDPLARLKAEELDRALMVLSTFDEGPDLVLFYKRLMVLEGNPEYEHHFNEGDRLSPSQDAYIVSQHALFQALVRHLVEDGLRGNTPCPFSTKSTSWPTSCGMRPDGNHAALPQPRRQWRAPEEVGDRRRDRSRRRLSGGSRPRCARPSRRARRGRGSRLRRFVRHGGAGEADLAFVIDPVDGTLNYASDLPLFAVMAAALHKGEPVAALILDPNLDDCAMALRGEGAWLEDAAGARRNAPGRNRRPARGHDRDGQLEIFRRAASLAHPVGLPAFRGRVVAACCGQEYRLGAAGAVHVQMYAA